MRSSGPRRVVAASVLALASVLGAAPADASTGAGARFAAVRAAHPPALDASLGDAAWSTALAAGELQTITTQRPSRFGARFALLYDDGFVYVGMRLDQPRALLTATQTTNNVAFGVDDFAGIGIDTSGTGSEVYYFLVNPRGTRYQSASQSARYDPAWAAVAGPTASGWNAMLRIPRAALRTPGTGSQTWRINFVRRIAALDLNESWAWDPLMTDGGGGTAGFPAFTDARFWPQLGGLRFSPLAARPHPRAEIFALAGAGPERDRFALAGNRFGRRGARPLGADLVLPVTGTSALVATLAPDFSNVEVDQQTIAPQKFARTLTEYRPFFAQGNKFFTPATLIGVAGPANRIFYSPAIGPFDRGIKFEGTSGWQSFGALEVKGAGFDDTVLGYKHRTPDRTLQWSLDGVLAHHQAGNATADPRALSDGTWQAQVTGRDNRTGFVYGLDYAKQHGTAVSDDRLAYKSEDFVDLHKPNFEVLAGWRAVGPQYAPVLGYTQKSDVRGPFGYVDWSGTLAPHGPVKRADLFVTGDRFHDGSGAVGESDTSATLDLQLGGGLHLSGGTAQTSLRGYAPGGGAPRYAGGVTRAYDQDSIGLGYKEGTPAPVSARYSWGPFGDVYLQQLSFSLSRALVERWNVGLDLGGTLERSRFGLPRNGQWLHRFTVSHTIDADTSFSLALRTISGSGGFASPGVNLAGSLHRRFRNDHELFVDYGTSAAPSTVQRLLLKYIVRIGGGAGI